MMSSRYLHKICMIIRYYDSDAFIYLIWYSLLSISSRKCWNLNAMLTMRVAYKFQCDLHRHYLPATIIKVTRNFSTARIILAVNSISTETRRDISWISGRRMSEPSLKAELLRASF
jgi:hypothetical protein